MNLIDKFRKAITDPIGRIELIIGFHESGGGFQHNHTPLSVVNKMLSKTSLDKDILVMFNLEFLEVLIKQKGIRPERVKFMADTDIEMTFAQFVYGVEAILCVEEEYKNSTFIKKVNDMKFDLVFSNPPYNGNVDLKILQELKPHCKEMVVVHPSTWLIDLKGKSKLYNDFKSDLKLKSVELFNGNPVFDIGLFVPCAITHIDAEHEGNIDVKFFEDEYSVEHISQITKFGKDWDTIVKPFMDKISAYVAENGNVWDKRVDVSKEEEGKFYVQLAGIRGNWDKSHLKMVRDDFYTITIGNDTDKGIRAPSMTTYQFENISSQENFLQYLTSDFARFTLGLLKISQNNHRGEMALIPWMDFSQEWNDEKLYSFFEIDQVTQDYIRNFLPDYYGIRS